MQHDRGVGGAGAALRRCPAQIGTLLERRSHSGFTEYFAVWHVAASGLASREWFAERIAILDAAARGSAAYGQVRFGDPDVGWRDHDGPREKLGYRGGAMLAFHADVELRRQGRPGLLQLIADLMQQDDRRLQLERIRACLRAVDRAARALPGGGCGARERRLRAVGE